MIRHPFRSVFWRIAPALLAIATAQAQAQRGPVPGLNTSTPYLIHYGDWTSGQVDFARLNYRMVIIHPSSNITKEDIAILQAGPDGLRATPDDVMVLAYISVGEDARTSIPYAGDGTGPRVDPRASDDEPLEGIAPLGNASPSGTGYASYYLDDGDHNGLPDQNPYFGGCYVNPGDPAWFTILRTMTKDFDGQAGMEELLTADTGRGYACDGLFLDTLDTPAPNSFGGTRYEWTTPAYQALLQAISTQYPDKLLLGNRGLFFYNPNLKTYRYTLRPYLNLVMFESYYTDSSNSGLPSAYFDDNKFNYAPKLNAEAGRADGFTVICLGYDPTPPLPPATIQQDFAEAQGEQGWPLYRTLPSLDAPFHTGAADWNAAHPDTGPPVWDSTAAQAADSDPATPGNQPPPARTGIQQAVAGGIGQVTVRWDVARDQTGPVRYNIYHATGDTLDFATATKLAAVSPSVPAAYATGTGSGRYPYEFTVTGLDPGQTHRFAVRAEDALGNEDTNTVVLQATTPSVPSHYAPIAIDGSFVDWEGAPVAATDAAGGTALDIAEVAAANDGDFLYLRVTLHAAGLPFSSTNTHLYLDTDNNPATGHAPQDVAAGTFGSEMMVEWGSGYDQRNGAFNAGNVNGLRWSISPVASGTQFEIRLARSAVFASDNAALFTGNTIGVLLQDNRGPEMVAFTYSFAASPPGGTFAAIAIDGDFADWDGVPMRALRGSSGAAVDFASVQMANNNTHLFVRLTLHAAPPAALFSEWQTNLFLDTDDNPASGYLPTGSTIGSECLVQGGAGYDERGGGFNEGSTGDLGWQIAGAGTAWEFRLARAAAYADGAPVFGGDKLRLLFEDDRGPVLYHGAGIPYAMAADPAPSAYRTWLAGSFDAQAMSDADVTGPLADPDHDGRINLLEFAFNSNPTTGDPGEGLAGGIHDTGSSRHLSLTYTRRPSADGVTYRPEACSDLANWDASPALFVTLAPEPLPDGFERVTVHLAAPVGASHRFLRLRIEANP